jgi:hypothetical protein
MRNQRSFSILSVGAAALAVMGMSLATPSIMDSVRSQIEAPVTVSAPTYEYDQFDRLHNRGPADVGVNRPGFVRERPIMGPASENR